MIVKKLSQLMVATAFLTSATPALANDVEVLHWWTSGGEAAALNILKKDLASQGVGWQDMPVAGGGGEAATTTLKARVSAGNPPTAAQLLGMAVKEWAAVDSLGDISTIAKAENWESVVPDAVKNFAINDGKWVAVPVNIHRPNWLWINRAIFEKHDLTPPTTWKEFNAVAKTLKEAGVIPLAHGGQPWQDATLFDDVVLGIGGPEFYRAAIHNLDPKALGSETMKAVFDEMRIIRGFVDDNFSGRDWNLATAMVINGQAAMQLMGDWAKGELIRAGVTPGKEVLCVTAPGTEGSFLFITDFFAFFDVNKKKQSSQQAMAAAVMSPEFQEAFNLVKGSIPARTDVSSEKFDVCGQKSITDIASANANGTLLGSLAHGHGQTSSVQRAIIDVVTEHFNSDMSSEDAVEELLIAVESAQL